MKYKAQKRCSKNIVKFYLNVSRKYKHTYSDVLMHKNIDDAVNAMFLIEKSLPRRLPTTARWKNQGYYMANTDKWYYAYTIDGDTITIQDACHAQNMHEGQ